MSENLIATPTVQELKQKAEETRAEAESLSLPAARANMLKIAEEYDRLAAKQMEFRGEHAIGCQY